MSENTINENEYTTNAESNNADEPTTEVAANGQATSETVTAQEIARAAIIKIEGQEIPLDTAIAADDNLLKTALSPHYPSIKNAQITRETRLGQMIVSIVKKAEHKGINGQ